MKRDQAVFPSLILAFTLTMLAVGYFHYQYSWTAFAFPFASGLLVSFLCILEIAAVFRRQGGGASPARPVSLTGVAWLFALAAFLYAFGFVFGAALYLLVCLRGNDFSWRLSLGTGAVSLIVTWGIFIKVLGVQLPLKPLWMG